MHLTSCVSIVSQMMVRNEGMSQLRNTLPALLSIGIGYCGYQYVYKGKSSGPLQVEDGITVAKPWKVALYARLPLNSMSRLWGNMNSVDLPTWARQPVCQLYAWLFNCNLSEMYINDLSQYRNLSEFFRRRLKSDCRPVDKSCLVTCPSDGTVLHFGKVSGDQIEQVKGFTYSLSRFLGPPDWTSGDTSNCGKQLAEGSVASAYSDKIKYNSEENDLYHAVIYLAPGDYHRFHSPTEWNVSFRRHFPESIQLVPARRKMAKEDGLLLSVNPSVARRIPSLFCLNERVAYIGQWKHGFFAYVAVGATNVGSIKVYHDKSLLTNSREHHSAGFHIDKNYQKEGERQPVSFSRGDSFGEFNLGSTIVVVFEAPKSFSFALKPGQKIKYGQVMGK